jgi:hypothetical protein
MLIANDGRDEAIGRHGTLGANRQSHAQSEIADTAGRCAPGRSSAMVGYYLKYFPSESVTCSSGTRRGTTNSGLTHAKPREGINKGGPDRLERCFASGDNEMSAAPTGVITMLADITLDADLQPRQRIDETTSEEHLHALVDGAVFPPVTVFLEGAEHRLADGFHRWHAHKAAGSTEISATRLDAMRFALGANASHGKRREPGDYRSAYTRARDHGLIEPTDATAVQALLRCTTQWAYRLTESARADADARRAANIAARKAAGQSNRSIARDVGLSHQTVARATSGPKTNGLKMDHPTEPSLDLSDTLPRPPHSAPTEFNDMTSPSGQRWGALIDALRVVNDLPSAEELFNDRHRCLDVAIGPALMGAKARIDEIQRRYFGLQAEIAAAERARAQMDFLDLAGDFSRPIPSSLAMNEGPGTVRLQRPS